jgi:hypothetical protein
MSGVAKEERKRKLAPAIHQEEDQAPRKKKPRTWDESFRALVAYKEIHGNCKVPVTYQDDLGLGHWVCDQRRWRCTKLSQDQRDRLDQLGFHWETKQERDNRLWDEKFQKVREYRREHLDCCVPRNYKQDPELGTWVNYQRTLHSQGRLRQDRETKLESIGFTWSKSSGTRDTSKEDEKWFEKYKKLVDFSKEHGHCIVSHSCKKDRSLRRWVQTQRYFNEKEILKKDRKELLDELGFVWRIDKADANASLTQRKWDEMFDRLVEYKQINGHVNVPLSFQKWGLGRWVVNRLAEGRNGQLDPRRAKRLVAIGMNFDSRWNENFEKLKAYKKTNGHCRVSRTENNRLADWARRQRQYRGEGKLRPERTMELDAVGFVWHVKKHKPALNFDTGASRGVVATERRDDDRADLGQHEQVKGEAGNGLEESDCSDEEFEFKG